MDSVRSQHFDLWRDAEYGHTAQSTRRLHNTTREHRTPHDRTRAAFLGTRSTRGQTISVIQYAYDGIWVLSRVGA